MVKQQYKSGLRRAIKAGAVMTSTQRVLIVLALFLIPVFQAVGQGTDNSTVSGKHVAISACLVTSAFALSQSQLWNLNSYYIVPEFNQKGATQNLIADALLESELNVSMGAIDGIPEDTDVLVDYRSKWVGDLLGGAYLNNLLIFFRAPSTNELLGVARSYVPGAYVNDDTVRYGPKTDRVMALVYVRRSIAELLGYFEQPEGAPQC